MKIRLKRKIIGNGRSRMISIPIKIVKKFKIRANGTVIVKIKKDLFPTRIYNNKGYPIINIPLKICKKYGINLDDEVELQLLKQKREKRKGNKVKIVKINGGNYIDRYYLLPTVIKRNYKVNIHTISSKTLLIWLSSRKLTDWIVVPRYLPFDERKTVKDIFGRKISVPEYTFEVLGLYLGEGGKSGKVDFTNSEPAIINFFLEYFEKINNISRKNWSAYVIYRGPKFNYQIDKKLKKFWQEQTNIRNFTKTDYDFSPNKEKTKTYGSLRIRLNSFSTGIFLEEWKALLPLCFKDRKFAIALLRGIFVADGGLDISKSKLKSLRSINVTSYNSQLLNLYKKLLLKVGIIPDKKVNANHSIRISNWNNFYKFFQYKLFLLHPKQNKLFLKSFLNHKITRNLFKYLSAVKKPLTTKEVIKRLNLASTSSRKVRQILNRLCIQSPKFVNRIGKGLSNDPYKYSLAEEGKKFLKAIEEASNIPN